MPKIKVYFIISFNKVYCGKEKYMLIEIG